MNQVRIILRSDNWVDEIDVWDSKRLLLLRRIHCVIFNHKFVYFVHKPSQWHKYYPEGAHVYMLCTNCRLTIDLGVEIETTRDNQ